MPAPPRKGFRRNARQGRQNRPARGHNDRSIDLPRNSPRREYPRTETISRDSIRLLRHGPRRNEPPFPLRLEDGASTSFAEILDRATLRSSGLGEQELENIASADDPARKLRFCVYNSPHGERRVRAYNGHSLSGVIMPEAGGIPLTQRFILPATSLEAEHEIHRDGCRLVTDRKEFHFADGVCSARHHTYLRRSHRKSVFYYARRPQSNCDGLRLPQA